MNKNLLILWAIFFFIFFWFTSVQQFLTSYFIDNWNDNAWFYSLMLIYSGFFIWNLFFVSTIKKLGSKKSMSLASICYWWFIFSLLTNSIPLVYLASFIMWISAAFLWIWEQSYIILLLKGKNVWKAFALNSIFVSVWAAIWALIMWYIISIYSYQISFLIFGFFPIIAWFLCYLLSDQKEVDTKEEVVNKINIFKYFKNTHLLRLWLLNLSFTFMVGLFFSIVPIHITEVLWSQYIWPVTFWFFFILVIAAYYLWKKTDNYSTKKVIFILAIMWIVSMSLFTLYKFSNASLLLWITLLSIIYAILPSVFWTVINKIASEQNLKYCSSFFLIFSNLWIILWIYISSQIQSHYIYIIAAILMFCSLISYLLFSKRSFKEIKKDILQ